MIKHLEAFLRRKWVLALLTFWIAVLSYYVVRAAPIPIDHALSTQNNNTAQGAQPATLEPPDPVTVTLHIIVDDTFDNYPLITSNITTAVPASWPEIQAMRTHGMDEEAFYENYTAFLDRFSADGWIFGRYFSPADLLRNPPSITIQNESATLIFKNSEYIDNMGIGNPQIYSSGVTIRPAINTESETPLFAPQDFVLYIHHTKGAAPHPQPISTTHIIELEIKGLRVVSASPIPKRDDGVNLVWVFAAGESAEDVEVRLRPRLGTSVLLWTRLGFLFPPLNFLPRLTRSLSLASIFIAILLLIYGLRTVRLDSSVQNALGKLRYATIWALLLSFGIELFFRVFRINSWSIFDLPSLGLYLLLLLFWYQSQQSSKRRKLLLGLFSILFLAPTIYEILLMADVFRLEIDINHPDTLLLVLGTWSFIVLLRLGLITYIVLVGIISFAASLWPTEWLRWPGMWTKNMPKIPRLLSGSLLFLSILIVLFWLAFQFQSLGGSILLNFALKDSEAGFDILGYTFNEVRDASQNFALNMLGSASALLPFIVLAGVLGLLYELSRTSKTVYFLDDEEWALDFVAVLFAGFVVGTRGMFMGISIPVAFLVALIILHLILSNRIRQAEEKLRKINPALGKDAAFLLYYRKELLQRARALENIDQQQAALYGEHTSGKIDEKVYETKRAELQAEMERLAYGDGVIVSPQGIVWRSSVVEKKKSPLDWLIGWILRRPDPPRPTRQPIASLRLTKEISPNSIALSLGPGNNWWENASQALDIGWKLALFPVAFYLYVLFSENALFWLSPQTDFGVFLLLSGLLKEVVFWLTAAFILGCIYPYLPGANGVLKGTVLAMVWIASVLARQLIGLDEDTGWIFRSLQLLLFLALLGAGLDLQTLFKNSIYWRYILDYYQLRDVRTIIGYASPLILALIAIAQQILSGQALEAITEIIKNLPQTIPLF